MRHRDTPGVMLSVVPQPTFNRASRQLPYVIRCSQTIVPLEASCTAHWCPQSIYDLSLCCPLMDRDHKVSSVHFIHTVLTFPPATRTKPIDCTAPKNLLPTNIHKILTLLQKPVCLGTDRIMCLSSALKSQGCNILFFSELFSNSRENGTPQIQK